MAHALAGIQGRLGGLLSHLQKEAPVSALDGVPLPPAQLRLHKLMDVVLVLFHNLVNSRLNLCASTFAKLDAMNKEVRVALFIAPVLLTGVSLAALARGKRRQSGGVAPDELRPRALACIASQCLHSRPPAARISTWNALVLCAPSKQIHLCHALHAVTRLLTGTTCAPDERQWK